VIGTGRPKNQPGVGIAAQQTRTVTVKAIDPNVPPITVGTADGRPIARKIEDKKNINGVKAGDRIAITCTRDWLSPRSRCSSETFAADTPSRAADA
jgi:hypothetical protein